MITALNSNSFDFNLIGLIKLATTLRHIINKSLYIHIIINKIVTSTLLLLKFKHDISDISLVEENVHLMIIQILLLVSCNQNNLPNHLNYFDLILFLYLFLLVIYTVRIYPKAANYRL